MAYATRRGFTITRITTTSPESAVSQNIKANILSGRSASSEIADYELRNMETCDVNDVIKQRKITRHDATKLKERRRRLKRNYNDTIDELNNYEERTKICAGVQRSSKKDEYTLKYMEAEVRELKSNHVIEDKKDKVNEVMTVMNIVEAGGVGSNEGSSYVEAAGVASNEEEEENGLNLLLRAALEGEV